jgi:Antibiotic biosynthesis monooxygenase
MTNIRIHRYAVDEENLEEFIARRAALIAAMRERHPGLTETRLIRLDDGSFVDTWRWASADEMQAAFASVPDMPEVRAAMSLARDASNDDGEVVDER